MLVVGATAATTTVLAIGSHLLARWKLHSLYRELFKHRDVIATSKKALDASYEQENRIVNRLYEVLLNPNSSDDPDWEIDGCETILKELPNKRSALEEQIKTHRHDVRHTIQRIRKWQKILPRRS